MSDFAIEDMEIINEAKKIKFEQNDETEKRIVMDENEISEILDDLETPLKDSITASLYVSMSNFETMINKSK